MRVIMSICPIITKKYKIYIFYSITIIEFLECRVLFYCGGLGEILIVGGMRKQKIYEVYLKES